MGTLGRNIDKICQKNAKIVNDFGVFLLRNFDLFDVLFINLKS